MQATSLDNYGGQVSEALLTCTYTLCHAFSERPIICFNIKWSLKLAYFCIWRNLSPTQCLFIKQTVFHCTLWTHLHLNSYIIQTYIDLNMLFMHKREFTRCKVRAFWSPYLTNRAGTLLYILTILSTCLKNGGCCMHTIVNTNS